MKDSSEKTFVFLPVDEGADGEIDRVVEEKLSSGPEEPIKSGGMIDIKLFSDSRKHVTASLPDLKPYLIEASGVEYWVAADGGKDRAVEVWIEESLQPALPESEVRDEVEGAMITAGDISGTYDDGYQKRSMASAFVEQFLSGEEGVFACSEY